jgi:hypothetical protein
MCPSTLAVGKEALRHPLPARRETGLAHAFAQQVLVAKSQTLRRESLGVALLSLCTNLGEKGTEDLAARSSSLVTRVSRISSKVTLAA